MFKVKLTPRSAGAKRPRKPLLSVETFADTAAAKRWIVANMTEQEKTAWQSAGLVDVKREETPTGYTMTVTPALRLVRGLILTYEIVPA